MGAADARRQWRRLVAVIPIAVMAGCNGDDTGTSGTSLDPGDSAASSTASSTTTSAASGTSGPTASTAPDTDATTTAPAVPVPTGPNDETDGEAIAFGDLFDRRLDGARVTFTAAAFFLEECPPPDGQAGPCSLLLFLADPARTDLLYGDRDEAVPGWIDENRVSCEVGPDTRTACPGWTAGARYDITGIVRFPPTGPPDVHIDQAVP